MKKNNKNNMGYYCDLFIKSSFIKNKKSTTTTYRYIIYKHIYPYFKDYYKDNIDISVILCFINKLKSMGLKNKSIRDILLVLKGIFKLMCISIMIPKPKLEKKEIKVISYNDQKVLEEYLNNNISYINFGIYLSLYTGLRIGEVCALNTNDIDINLEKISIHHTLVRVYSNNKKKTILELNSPKTNNSIREIPIPKFLINYYQELDYNSNSYILTNNNKYMDTRTLSFHYKKVLKELMLNNYTFHTLRHSFATRLINEGCDPKTLSLILGHANINVTLERYVHPNYKSKKIFIDKLKPL